MELVVRPAEPHELREVADVMRVALLNPVVKDDAEWERGRASWEHDHLAIGAWDGGRCVGHAGSFHFDTVVPGGAWLPTAGITRVGVLPTHTRRGLLTRMMRRLLDDERAAGKVLSSLRASEAVIYGRFGFGLAGEAVRVALQPMRARPLRGTAAGTFRLLQRDELLHVVPDIYRRLPLRPGGITRPPGLWRYFLKDALEATAADFVVVHTSSGGADDGFAHYAVKWEQHTDRENLGTCEVFDVFGADPATELALWDYVLGISLMRTVTSSGRPVDDVLRLAVRDPRAYETTRRWDEQWLRLLDVEAAMRARTFGTGEPVTIEVSDPWYPDNDGTYRVARDGVERVGGAGELRVAIDALSAAYMGNMPWRDLLVVGRVDGTPDAAARADALFAHHPTSWSGSFF